MDVRHFAFRTCYQGDQQHQLFRMPFPLAFGIAVDLLLCRIRCWRVSLFLWLLRWLLVLRPRAFASGLLPSVVRPDFPLLFAQHLPRQLRPWKVFRDTFGLHRIWLAAHRHLVARALFPETHEPR